MQDIRRVPKANSKIGARAAQSRRRRKRAQIISTGINMSAEMSAASAGQFTIGGNLTVNRLGFGAMRLTGKDVWGDPLNIDNAL
jgi:hypothetical protein